MSFLSNLLHRKKHVAVIDIEEARISIKNLEILTENLVGTGHSSMFRIITDNLDTPIWGKDLDGKFIHVNKACAEKILRTTQDEALAMGDEEFKHDSLAYICMASDRDVRDSMQTMRFIEHARYPDGHDLWIDTTKSPMIVDGVLKGTVGTGRDITKSIDQSVRDEYAVAGRIEIGVDTEYCKEEIMKLISGAQQ